MNCIKCSSHRVIRFLDGFGKPRVFCKTCQESIPLMEFEEINNMKKLWEFTHHQDNTSIKIGQTKRW
jgi:hypothetical protein